MTKEDAFKLRNGVGFPAPSSVGCFPTISSCPSLAKTSILIPDQPRDVPDSAFNSFTPQDVLYLQQFKHSDPLHRGDNLAKDYSRGDRLRKWMADNGTEKFNSRYGLPNFQ